MAQRSKSKTISLGTNVVSYQDNNMLWVGIDLDYEGEQTKRSLEGNGPPKEMVGTTRSFTGIPGTDCTMMLHITRPMEVKVATQNKRTARALNELDDEDQGNLDKLAGIDPDKVATILALLKQRE